MQFPKPNNFTLKSSLVVAALLMSAGCMVGPKYQRPPAPAAPQYKEGASPNTGQANPIGYSNWWLVYHDDELNRLEQQTDEANWDIRAAVARVEQAQQYLKEAHSHLFPTVSAGGSASRNREAQDRPNNGNTGGLAATYNDFQISMLMGYEIDFWGRLRHTVQAAAATEQSSQADLRFVRLVAETGVAMNYFGLRELDSERNVLLATVEALGQAEQLTENRRRGGLASDYDVYQAKTILDQTESQAKQIEIQRAQYEHAIAVLAGQNPSIFSLPRMPPSGAPPVIPAGVPSELLEHRPDIQSVERMLAASNAQIGVARALQFPQFTISGAAGFESVNPSSVLAWQNSLASLGAGVSAPIFTAGRLKAQVEQAKANYRETLAQYEQAVLTGFQQVEDQLAAIRILAGEAASTGNAVNDAQRTEEIAVNQYKTGLVDYLNVVNAQATLLYNQRTQTQIEGQQMVASVALIKALGGGWLSTPDPAGNRR
ncbi:MAG: efflux transporter outer membrane subunit [Acidobacteriaceae bacterium]|nr:efflux transporter outer membrane subunit [Acidobacteriaceae bacterium]